MSVHYASIVPHSPALIPTIGKQELSKLEQTTKKLEHINTQLIENGIETIVVIAPHDESSRRKDEFLIHLPTRYTSSFEEFGDLVTKKEYAPDPVLAHAIKKDLEEDGFTVSYASEEKLEYSAGVPLYYLMKNSSAKLIIIHPAEALLKKQFEFGRNLQKSLQKHEKKIACIVSGDLSHCLSNSAPGGLVEEAVTFDQEVVSFVKAEKVRKLQKLDMELANRLGACGIPAIVLLFGFLDHMEHESNFLSYEAPLGVGQLVMEFTF
ncbi:MAG: class III extradiol dioxygenase subunit B-like domain-containing protein [bacterium]|nr:class III extradiol dioxygenase subunit B-like domain-containing protein [bacterium]